MNIKEIKCKSKIVNMGILLLLSLCFVGTAHSEPIDSLYIEDVYLIKGELEQVKVYSLTRVSLESPAVADIVKADDQEILIIGKAVGQTALFLWDEHGKRTLMIHVVNEELNRVKRRLEELLSSADISEVDISINENEGKLVVTGTVPDHKKKHFDAIVMPFKASIIELVEEKEERALIQIDAEVVEIKTTLIESLGIDWSSSSSTSGISIGFAETLPVPSGMTGGGSMDLFNMGDFDRSDSLAATFHALIQQGDSKVISKPKLLVLNGESASFNVGGEYPIKSTTVSGDSSVESISFKTYGVGMDVVPTIIKDKIELDISLNISDVDASISVDDATAFGTTDISTKLYLRDGQLVIIGGLIKKNEAETTKKIPYLYKIPIVGRALFTYRTKPSNSDSEIILSLRPTIIRDTKGTTRTESIENSKDVKNSAIDVSDEEMVPTSAVIPSNMTEYVKTVQKQIAQAISYPEEAKATGWEGSVKIGLKILKDGTLFYAMTKESSGNEEIDNNALRAARTVAPFLSFPEGSNVDEINIVIPIAYNMKR